jgi:hypothetical protein
LCSPPPRQRAAAIEGPHDAIGADEAQDGAAKERFEGRLPGRQGEGVRAADDGELAARRRDGALVDTGDPASGSCGTWMAFSCRDSIWAKRTVSRCLRLRIISGFGATSSEPDTLASPRSASQRLRSESACRSSAGKPGVSSCRRNLPTMASSSQVGPS